MVKLILPTGQCFKICKQGLDLLVAHKWHILDKVYLSNKCSLFHRMLVSAPKSMAVDHIDRDYFNLHVSNLRVCTPYQNNLNRGKFKSSRNKYKGIRRSEDHDRPKPWQARIAHNGKRHTKRFATELEAVKWYNETIKQLHGEFAVLNEIEGQ